MKASHVPASQCPACRTEINAATVAEGAHRPPSVGDFCVCIWCASFLCFDADMQLRLLSMDEIAALDDEARNELVRARRRVNRLEKRK